MAEQFAFQDLSDAVFWGVDLQRATFRDVDLMGARISHARLADVVIDAEIDRLVINGVDVTAYINERDDWFALRSQLHPTEPDNMRQGWQAFLTAWVSAIERARSLPEEQRHASVDGEWSFVETIRHLVFATDKWFTVPILGGAFLPIGLPTLGQPTSAGQGSTTSPTRHSRMLPQHGWTGGDNYATTSRTSSPQNWRSTWRFSRTAQPPCTTASGSSSRSTSTTSATPHAIWIASDDDGLTERGDDGPDRREFLLVEPHSRSPMFGVVVGS
jgi:hypothetical protein